MDRLKFFFDKLGLLTIGALAGCATIRSPFQGALPKSPLRVVALGTQELGQGDFEGRGPPQSPVPPLFLPGNRVLLTTMGGRLELRDATNFAKIWTLPARIGFASQPLILGSSLYAAGMDARLRKLRWATGEVEWETRLPAESAGGVAASQGAVFVTTSDNSLTAFDEKKGRVLWTYKRPSPDSNVLWSLAGSSVPVVHPDGKTVYVGFSDGVFVALEASSGKTLWERSFERPGRFKDVDTPPVLSEDGSVLYLSVVDGDCVALRTKDGSSLWALPGAAASAPLVDEEHRVLYLSTRDGTVTKFSLEDNRVLWRAELGRRGMGSRPVLVKGRGVAVSTSHAGVVLLDNTTGALVWEESFGIGGLATPVFDGRRLAVLSNRNRLHLYSVDLRAL